VNILSKRKQILEKGTITPATRDQLPAVVKKL
jgi:hypothetical protein